MCDRLHLVLSVFHLGKSWGGERVVQMSLCSPVSPPLGQAPAIPEQSQDRAFFPCAPTTLNVSMCPTALLGPAGWAGGQCCGTELSFGGSALLSSQLQEHCCRVERLAQLPCSEQRMWLWERSLQHVQMPGIQLESPGQKSGCLLHVAHAQCDQRVLVPDTTMEAI